MKIELIRLNTEDGLNTQGLLFVPEKPTKKVCIHVHGSAGNFYENSFVDDFAKCYTNNDCSFLTFNNRGSEFYKEFVKCVDDKKSYETIGMLNEKFEDCIFDIQGAINFVKQLGYNEIILQGHSLGCNKVVWYALEKHFQGKIVLLAPCDLFCKNSHLDYAKARQLVAENKGNETISKFWDTWNISANTLVSVWGDNVNADMFRYRDCKINNNLHKINNKIMIEIGTIDPSCVGNFDIVKIQKYLEKSFDSAALKIDVIKNANHHYAGKEKEVCKNLENFI